MADYQGHTHIPVDDLSAYADGQIADPAERQRIEQHLQVCAECRDELRQLQAISSLLADLPDPELPRSFRLSPEDLPAGAAPVPIAPWIVRQQAVFRVAAMAAVLVLALVVTIDLYSGQPEDDTNEVSVMMDAPQEEAAPESDEPDAGDMGVEEEDEEDAEVPEDMPAAESDEDAAGDQDEAVEDAPEEMPATESEEDTAEDRVEEEAAGEDDSGERASEEADSAAESDQEREATEDGAADLATTAQEDDGVSTLRVIAIGLGVISVALLTVGFVIPRWWSSSASRS